QMNANHSKSFSNVSGNVFDKYGSKNPVVRLLMKGFFGQFKSLLSGLQVKQIVEVGCGEGEIGHFLSKIFPDAEYRGFDIAGDVVQKAKQRYPVLHFEMLSIYDLPKKPMKADLFVASEVFEHLDDPVGGMNALLAMDFEYLLVSVPREPVWRVLNVARGKYLSALGNTPGHVNHWSKIGFEIFLNTFSGSLSIVSIADPFPWTMVLLRRQR
ncbi:MAG TPA: class I SAM-dependent methyltransferase, partial [Bacteroidota bacterium]|nr:class I SAM-dependent methyltransferase [Bacteroidota bacterium]